MLIDWTQVKDWYLNSLDAGGYPLIAGLMAVESSIVPLPSEMVIPPAAHVADARGTMSLAGIVIAGTFGCWLGATAMYWASRTLGRPIVLAYGKYFFISPENVYGAERWAMRFGSPGIFISRLLPVVRHLIGIPAGIVKMGYGKFSLFTILGSGIWCSVLAWVGVKAGQDEQLMKGDLRRIMMWLLPAVLILGLLWYFGVKRQMEAPQAASAAPAPPPPPSESKGSRRRRK